MKKILSLGLLSIITLFCVAQTPAQKVAEQFTAYFNSIKNHEFEKSVSYMPKEMFELATKEELIAGMEAGLNNPDITVGFSKMNVKSVELPKQINDKYYSVLRYGCLMSMAFLTGNFDNQTMMTSLAASYGSANVNFEEINNRFDIYYEKNVCAISLDGKSDWTFVELEPTGLDDLKFFIPNEILDSVKTP